MAERVSEEAFVLGDAGQGQFDQDQLLRLAEDVLDLYYVDFIRYYEELLGDLDIVPTTEIARAAEMASVLAGPGSPMEEILKSVAHETKLTAEPQGEIDVGGLKVSLADVVKRELFEDLSVTSLRLLRAVQSNTNQQGQPQKPPGGEVEDRFSFLYDLLDDFKGPSQIAELKSELQLVAKELNQNVGRKGVLDLPELALFVERAKVLGDPIAKWAQQLASAAAGGVNGKGREAIDGDWKTNVLPTCQAVTALYPFDRRAAGEAGIQEFRAVFGNDGLLDKFFKERLQDIVDTTQRPWVFRQVNGKDLGIPNEVLAEFERAAEIPRGVLRRRRPAGGGIPDHPLCARRRSAFSAVLEVDGHTIVFTAHRQAAEAHRADLAGIGGHRAGQPGAGQGHQHAEFRRLLGLVAAARRGDHPRHPGSDEEAADLVGRRPDGPVQPDRWAGPTPSGWLRCSNSSVPSCSDGGARSAPLARSRRWATSFA